MYAWSRGVPYPSGTSSKYASMRIAFEVCWVDGAASVTWVITFIFSKHARRSTDRLVVRY